MEKITFNHGLSVMWPPKKLLLIMKLIIVLMTTFLMQVSAAGFAQKITYAKKGATLEQIFTEIRKQTGYFVVYAEDKVDKQTKMDVYFKNTDLTDVLDVISKSQDLSYSFNEKNIGLKPKEKSYLETVIDRFQAIDVRGKVVDSLGNGLAGATVSVKGTNKSTQTTQNGEFYLKGVDEGALLVVSYLGYITKEVSFGGGHNLIKLSESNSKLDEVQIQAYGTTTRRFNTGNISTVKAKDIEQHVVSNPMLALKGMVPGMTVVQSSGVPGAAVKINIRGINSFVNGTQPLVLIDGIPFDANLSSIVPSGRGSGANFSALSFINPADIESISVLKVSIALSCQEES